MILDTDFLIDLNQQRSDATAKASKLEEAGVPLRVPTVVVQGLYVGVGAGGGSIGDAQTYEALVANKLVVDLNERIARRAGVLEGQHIASETKPDLGTGDAVVAATALQYNEPVVTSDRDFTHVDGLAVELV